MDSPSQSQPVVYETLSPLPLETQDPYTVYRTEISLPSHCRTSPASSAPDFFSLEVEEDGFVDSAPAVAATEFEPKMPAPIVQPKLETAWFQGTKFRSPMLQLHKEIVDFCDFLSPTPEEQELRNRAVQSVFDVIKYIWPHCKAEVFGSFRTGLYLPTSDIDVVILNSGIRSAQMGLRALSKALSQRGIAKNIQVIGKARVPIIKFVEKRSDVRFDISFDAENGPIAADFIKDAVSKWPPLRPLCLILKVFLQQRELNEVYSGGVGSYALLAMLLGLFRSVHVYQSCPEQNLGVLLVHFFEFYGQKLNTSDVGISCNGVSTFFAKKSKGFFNRERPFLISIEDPQAPENDIGKNSFNYFQIRSAFTMAFTTLTNPKVILGLGCNTSILGTIIRADSVLVERKGGWNGDITFDRLLAGAGEPLQSHNGDRQETLSNWIMDGEGPLPRGNRITGDDGARSSGKKRKASCKEKSRKKIKENGQAGKMRKRHKLGGSSAH